MKLVMLAALIALTGCATGPHYESAEFGEMLREMPCVERINWYPTIEALNLAVIRAGHATYYSEEFGYKRGSTGCWTLFLVTPRPETQANDIYNIGHGFTHILSLDPHWHSPDE